MGRHLNSMPTVVVPAHLASHVSRPLEAALEERRRRGQAVPQELLELVMDLVALGRWSEGERLGSDRSSDVGTLLASEGAEPGVWLTTTEAAELLDVTPRWVRQLADDGRLRARWSGGVRLIDPASVTEYRDGGALP